MSRVDTTLNTHTHMRARFTPRGGCYVRQVQLFRSQIKHNEKSCSSFACIVGERRVKDGTSSKELRSTLYSIHLRSSSIIGVISLTSHHTTEGQMQIYGIGEESDWMIRSDPMVPGAIWSGCVMTGRARGAVLCCQRGGRSGEKHTVFYLKSIYVLYLSYLV